MSSSVAIVTPTSQEFYQFAVNIMPDVKKCNSLSIKTIGRFWGRPINTHSPEEDNFLERIENLMCDSYYTGKSLASNVDSLALFFEKIFNETVNRNSKQRTELLSHLLQKKEDDYEDEDGYEDDSIGTENKEDPVVSFIKRAEHLGIITHLNLTGLFIDTSSKDACKYIIQNYHIDTDQVKNLVDDEGVSDELLWKLSLINEHEIQLFGT